MRKLISGIPIAFLLVTLFGCGAANLNSSLNSQQQLSIKSGNWTFSATSSSHPGSQFLIGGHLEQNGKTFAGILHIASSRCFNVETDIPVSGTVQDGSLELRSLPIEGQVLHASLIGNDATLVGNYEFSGGCSAGDAGSLNANLVPPVSGMWNAVEESAGNTPVRVNLALAQSANANGHGVYPVAGTLAFSGSPCQVSARIASGFVAGSIVVLNAETQEANGSSGALRMEGDFSAGHVPSIVGAYSYGAGSCKDKAGVLTFTP